MRRFDVPKYLKLLLVVVAVFLFGKRSVFAVEEASSSDKPEPEITIVVTPPPAAIQPIDLTISPITLNLLANPGEEVTSSMKVFNNSSEKEYLEIKLAKFSADKSGSRPQIREFDFTDEYQNWLTFERDTFVVNPREWQTINLKFSPPQNAALSYYYAIIVKRQVDTTDENATTVVTGAPAILVLANVFSPNAIQELQLVDFRVKKFYEYLPVEFEIDIRNTGNIHLNPLGNVFIDKGNKKDIALLSINKGSGLVLPDSQRTYKAQWTQGFPVYEPVLENGVEKKDKNGDPVYKLNWDLSKIKDLRFGKYTANLLLVYDNGERDIPIESVVSFWVFPWRLVLALLGIIVGLIALGMLFSYIMFWRKNRKKKNKMYVE